MESKAVGTIMKVNGPIIMASLTEALRMMELVEVSHYHLIGEVLSLKGNTAVIQVYEDTSGIKPGDTIFGTGLPLSVELGPGLIGNVIDGIQRPLEKIEEKSGIYIGRGIAVSSLQRDKKWHFKPVLSAGATIKGGDIFGLVPETPLIEHRVMFEPGLNGTLVKIEKEGEFTLDDVIAVVKNDHDEEIPVSSTTGGR